MILAINTAFMEANVGLILNDGKRIERTIDAKSKHSEHVLKTIDEVCTEAGVNINDIEIEFKYLELKNQLIFAPNLEEVFKKLNELKNSIRHYELQSNFKRTRTI